MRTDAGGHLLNVAQHPTQYRGVDRQYIRSLALTAISRVDWAHQSGLSHPLSDGTFRRDLYKALGYPRALRYEDYENAYSRGGVATRIIEAYPDATWGSGAEIYDDETAEADTEFEKAIKGLADRLDLWGRLRRVDILANIGHYSVLLIGAAGKLDTELPADMLGPDSVLYLTPIAEKNAEILTIEKDESSPRYGLPLMYQCKFGSLEVNGVGMNQKSSPVHWTRIIHVADGVLENDLVGIPRLRSPWNYLLDLAKIAGGGSEAAWQRMDPGLHINLDKEVELTPEEEEAFAEEIEEYVHGGSKVIRSQGVNVTPLAANVAGFKPNSDAILGLCASTTGIPQRILKGSEQGELASSQDAKAWAQRIDIRRGSYAVPIVRAFVSRLVLHKALPVPKKPHVQVQWPDERSDAAGKAAIASTMANANSSMRGANGEILFTSAEIRDQVYGLSPLKDEQHPGEKMTGAGGGSEQGFQRDKGVVGFDRGSSDDATGSDNGGGARRYNAIRAQLTAAPELRDMDDEMIDAVARAMASDPNTPEYAVVHRAADRFRSKVAATMLAMWLSAASMVSANADLTQYIEQRDVKSAQRVALDALDEAEYEVGRVLPHNLRDTEIAAAVAVHDLAKARGTWLRDGATEANIWNREQSVELRSLKAVLRTAADDDLPFEVESAALYTAADFGSPFDISFNLNNPYVTEFAILRSAELIREISATTREAIRATVAEGIAEGVKPRVLKSRIIKYLGLTNAQYEALTKYAAQPGVTDRQVAKRASSMLRDRAALIARTETMRAANEGIRALWNEGVEQGTLPGNLKRVWIDARDGRVRDGHRLMHGQIRGLNERFLRPDTGARIEPGEEPNCRCVAGIASPADFERAGMRFEAPEF